MVIPGDEPGALIEIQDVPTKSDSGRQALLHDPERLATTCGLIAWTSTSSDAFDVPILAGRGFESADIALCRRPPRINTKVERSLSTRRLLNGFSAATPSAGAFGMSTGAGGAAHKCGVRALVRDRRHRQ